MFSVTILGSGSAGNCALVQSGATRLLVDGGLSARQITKRLAEAGVEAASLNAVVLTHEHCDHVAGMRVFCKQNPELPVYCTRLTTEVLKKEELAQHTLIRQFQAGSDFMVGDIGIHSFSVPHDAVDPVGFVFHHGKDSLGFLTDLGVCTKLALERVRGVKTLLVETNYDDKLLQNDTRRPWSIKQRIMSRHGHLSNAAAAAVVSNLLGHGLQRAVLGHLSRDCNTPELAIGEVRAQLAAAGVSEAEFEIYCATQAAITPRFAISRATADGGAVPMQKSDDAALAEREAARIEARIAAFMQEEDDDAGRPRPRVREETGHGVAKAANAAPQRSFRAAEMEFPGMAEDDLFFAQRTE